MHHTKLTGPESASLKYDLLTALSVAGLSGSSSFQTSMLRLIAVVTARYNWRQDEMTVGQRDMARMWSVNERTVKREVKRLTTEGILICKRLGVRGRVGAYALNYRRIAEVSRPWWRLVGRDFEDRMAQRYAEPQGTVVPIRAFVPAEQPIAEAGQGTWAAAMARMSREAPDIHKAWFARVSCDGYDAGCLRLSAPSKFIQRYVQTHHMGLLMRCAESEMGIIDRVEWSCFSTS